MNNLHGEKMGIRTYNLTFDASNRENKKKLIEPMVNVKVSRMDASSSNQCTTEENQIIKVN